MNNLNMLELCNRLWFCFIMQQIAWWSFKNHSTKYKWSFHRGKLYKVFSLVFEVLVHRTFKNFVHMIYATIFKIIVQIILFFKYLHGDSWRTMVQNSSCNLYRKWYSRSHEACILKYPKYIFVLIIKIMIVIHIILN